MLHRRKTLLYSLFAVALLWFLLTTLFFLYKPIKRIDNKSNNDKRVAQLQQLESGVKSLYDNNNFILRDLNEFIRLSSDKLKKIEVLDKDDDNALGLKDRYKDGPVIPIIVFACNRVSVSICLDQLIKYRPNKDQFPIIVSQDCDDAPTRDTILKYGDQLTLIQQPDQSDIVVPPRERKFKGYFKIARHYGWALNQTFFKYNFDTAIIVEDDLDIAPDFFEYFLGTYGLLQYDPSLWCISAWNDNGKEGLVDPAGEEKLYRTDFFPGLGWMLTKDLWTELSTKWPKSYWDDWIRQPEQRKGRACIRPEISRTKTFGKIGVSNGMFYERHLKHIKLNEKFVPFSKMDLTYLMREKYDEEFVKKVYESTVVSYQELKENKIKVEGPVRIPYHTKETFKTTAKMLGLMDDFRSGVPRTGYKGIVTFHYNQRTVYLAPNINWKGYDVTWS